MLVLNNIVYDRTTLLELNSERVFLEPAKISLEAIPQHAIRFSGCQAGRNRKKHVCIRIEQCIEKVKIYNITESITESTPILSNPNILKTHLQRHANFKSRHRNRMLESLISQQ